MVVMDMGKTTEVTQILSLCSAAGWRSVRWSGDLDEDFEIHIDPVAFFSARRTTWLLPGVEYDPSEPIRKVDTDSGPKDYVVPCAPVTEGNFDCFFDCSESGDFYRLLGPGEDVTPEDEKGMKAIFDRGVEIQKRYRARNEEEVRKYDEAVKKKGGEVSA